MILKSLTLENIRSYENAKIEFPVGTSLFQGDIRSGKSTILYAIEFALFGTGSSDPAFLLRHGSSEGSVSLTFEVEGQEYEVHRDLTRKEKRAGKGYSITQTECWLQTPKGRMPLAASELKEEVLKILNFNEPPAARAQSVIYRYSVFTPQDEMKEIIRKNVDDRLQTLRRAFRVEDYKTAANNASTVNGVVREKVVRLDVQTQDLEANKKEWEGKQVEVGEIKRKLGPLSAEESRLDSEQRGNQSQLNKLRESRAKIEQLQEQIPEVKDEIAKKKSQRKELSDELADLALKVSKELMPAVDDLKNKKRPTDKTKDKLAKEIDGFETRIGELKELRGGLNKQKETFQKLLKERKCPVCMRPVRAGDFKSMLSHLKADSARLDSKIEQMVGELDKTEELAEELREYELGLKELKKLEPQLEEHRARIQNIAKVKLPNLDNDITDLSKKLTGLQGESGKLSGVSKQILVLEKAVEALDSKLREARSQITSFTTKLESSQHELEVLSKEIDQKQSMVKTQESLDEYRTWLVDYFVPTVETIEKHVMIAIWEKMNEQFQRWFQIMIEDPNLLARIDENFTPIVTQNGFDQDFESLSGGEKTSVALAYRLALNSTVREIAAGVKPNLLILDEPTDGFSKEQLFRIRDLLAELRCPQVVIVSHEDELDTCADHMFKVERINGLSQVSQIR